MKLPKLFLLVASLACALLSPLAQAKVACYTGFEEYTAGSNIHGQAIGTTTWVASGVLAGDQAIVSSSQRYSDGGANSFYLSQTVTGNRPRASFDLIAGGFISSAIPRGSVSFAVCEDPGNASGANYYTVNLGTMTLSRFASVPPPRIDFLSRGIEGGRQTPRVGREASSS